MLVRKNCKSYSEGAVWLANTFGSNAQRLGCAITAYKKKPGGQSAWSCESTARSCESIRFTRSRARSNCWAIALSFLRWCLFFVPRGNVALCASDGCSSIGRAPDSKSGGWGFKSLRPCSRLNSVNQICLLVGTSCCVCCPALLAGVIKWLRA